MYKLQGAGCMLQGVFQSADNNTQHLVPCTLHPAPFTLHLAP